MNSTPQWMSMADPIHGMIRLKRHNSNHQLLLDVMNSKAMQRLRRIKQMGMAEFVFPGATHSRFVHSIGAAWLMVKTIDHFMDYKPIRELLHSHFEDTDITLERLLLLSILVHDIGHTPLSHTLEDILDLKSQSLLHDSYWNRLILESDPELATIWARYGKNLPQVVAQFNGWDKQTQPHFLADLVSSQLDMDRLDYLLRDSHYLGVQYGRIEVDRIITNLVLGKKSNGEKVIAIREEALPALEHYLFGRYQAYKMALHALDKASETLLKMTLLRFQYLRDNQIDPGHPADLLYTFMTDGRKLTIDDYLMFDDCYLWDKINMWARYSTDPLLKQLANRLLGHDLFKYIEVADPTALESQETMAKIHEEMERYYVSNNLSTAFGFEHLWLAPKPLYQTTQNKPPIWIQNHSGLTRDFAEVTSLPLHPDGNEGKRLLFFVWDSKAKAHLKSLLDSL